MLHSQMDGLFVAVEEHLGGWSSAVDPLRHDDGMGFKVAMVGDSTMRVNIRGERSLCGGGRQCYRVTTHACMHACL